VSEPTTLTGGLDPQEIIEQPDYVAPDDDPTDPEVTDPADPSYVEPATDVTRPGGVER